MLLKIVEQFLHNVRRNCIQFNYQIIKVLYGQQPLNDIIIIIIVIISVRSFDIIQALGGVIVLVRIKGNTLMVFDVEIFLNTTSVYFCSFVPMFYILHLVKITFLIRKSI